MSTGIAGWMYAGFVCDDANNPYDIYPTESFSFPFEGSAKETQSFGVNTVDGNSQPHSGIDYDLQCGTDVLASRGGSVVAATNDAVYGDFIILDHRDGFQTLYAHLSSFRVSEGQGVAKGQGQSAEVLRNRKYKTEHKGQHRRNLADKKRKV